MTVKPTVERYDCPKDASNISGTTQRLKETGSDAYEAQKVVTDWLNNKLYKQDQDLKSAAQDAVSDSLARYRGSQGWDLTGVSTTQVGVSGLSNMFNDELADELLSRDGSKGATPAREPGMFYRVPTTDSGEVIPLVVDNLEQAQETISLLETWLESNKPPATDGGGQRFGKAKERHTETDEPEKTDNGDPTGIDQTAFEQLLIDGLHGVGTANVSEIADKLNNDPGFMDEVLACVDSVESYETADVDRLAAAVGEERAAELREVSPNKSDEELIEFYG